ncbi:hypothetical protein RCOM_0835860 [Ricinus communis]|uniref:Uncharacterized protein n=1 Tax=Ricinus communis TaxID=3988 RepID=B9S8U1_RICCO|nr:hypothetical protein RCOM_0835860 [Ricinus communis]
MVVDCKRREFIRVLRFAKLSNKGAVLVRKNAYQSCFTGFRWHGVLEKGTRVVRLGFLPVGNGLDIAHVCSRSLFGLPSCRAKIFLQHVLEVYTSKYMNASRALAWVIRSHPGFDLRRFHKAQAFMDEMGGASALFLPCAIYNWTPPEGAGQFHRMPLDVKVVHFKGSRKRLMLESWNFFRSASDISDMLCLILMSGRTKYDF